MMEERRFAFDEAVKWFEKALNVVTSFPQPKALANEGLSALRNLNNSRMHQEALNNERFAYGFPPPITVELMKKRLGALLYQRKVEEARKTANGFMRWAQSQGKLRDQCFYLAAKFLAQCAAIEKEPDASVQKVVDILQKLRIEGFFTPETSQRFLNDADFAAVRGHPTFAAFAKELTVKK
jgi:tetratricopeptide (TPR) repeat protein